MKLSRKWLNEYVDLPLTEIDDRTFAEAMSVSGSKVETTDDLSEGIRNVVVGRIVSIEKHPDSDHMLIAMLDVGKEQPVQIVTGRTAFRNENQQRQAQGCSLTGNALLVEGIEFKHP